MGLCCWNSLLRAHHYTPQPLPHFIVPLWWLPIWSSFVCCLNTEHLGLQAWRCSTGECKHTEALGTHVPRLSHLSHLFPSLSLRLCFLLFVYLFPGARCTHYQEGPLASWIAERDVEWVRKWVRWGGRERMKEREMERRGWERQLGEGLKNSLRAYWWGLCHVELCLPSGVAFSRQQGATLCHRAKVG